jgi:hypothetical protein
MRAWDDPFAREVATFRSPEDLVRVLASSAATDGEPLFRGQRGKLRKEGWQAAALSLGYQVMMGAKVEVRVVPDESFADFQLRLGGATLDFQSTLAVSGRNGNGNGNGHRSEMPAIPSVDTTHATNGGFDPTPLIMAARRKADGRDTRGVHLVICAGFLNGGAEPSLVAQVVRETLGDAYESAWVITGDRVLCAKRHPALPALEGWTRLPIQTPPIE